MARDANNKEKLDDDDLKNNHHQRAKTSQPMVPPVENHNRAAAPRERNETAKRDFELVRAAYENTTGNRWNKSDSEAYNENGIDNVPVDKVISALAAVVRRTPAKINSFNYFVKEIVTLPDSRNCVWKHKQLEKIVRRIRDSTVGHGRLFRDRFPRGRQMRLCSRRCPVRRRYFQRIGRIRHARFLREPVTRPLTADGCRRGVS